jgi:hypothetical protein
MANVERLRALEAVIVEVDAAQKTDEYRGDRWNQEDWRMVTSCGTAKCSAGWAVEMEAAERGIKNPWHSKFPSQLVATDAEIADDTAWQAFAENGTVWVASPNDRAAAWLELNIWEQRVLFFDTETDIDDLRDTIQRIVDGQWSEDDDS